jgi:uncharacterized membrane protein YedE/YeeE
MAQQFGSASSFSLPLDGGCLPVDSCPVDWTCARSTMCQKVCRTLNHFTPVSATLGGLLLGVACSLLLVADGRILGISGIIGEIPLAVGEDRSWRLVFLAGLLTGAFAVLVVDRSALAFASESTVPVALAAGVLVGFGTRLGHGCTSGHGLCGVARLSKRSIVATLVFIGTGALTVGVTRHVLHVTAGAP